MKGFIMFYRELFSVCNGNEELGAALDLLRMTDNKDEAAVITLRSLATEWGGKWNKDSVRRFRARLSGFLARAKNNKGETIVVRQQLRQECDKSATPNTKKTSELKRPLRQECDKNATPTETPPILEYKLEYIDTPLTPLKGGVPPTISKIYAKFDFSFVDDSLMAPFADWLIYKHDELKFAYKTQTSLEVCYRDLKAKSGGNPATAQAIVEQSIANGWKGLFNLKQERNNGDIGDGYYTGDNARFIRQAGEFIANIKDGDFGNGKLPF